ncbi:molybdopterin-binding protein [Alicyclobacillaceae bacterium I2511]|nr:molybdopterin-binding protein [Alicyclobacillaceae bacterium I2511]
MPLAHDLTRILPGEFKGRAFAKGHVIQTEDIPILLDMGKRFVYALEIGADELHENDAAVTMANAIAGLGIRFSDVVEGKVVLRADYDGMLWVDSARVVEMDLLEGISVTTRLPYLHVKEGTPLAGVRPIPLVIEKEKVDKVVRLAATGHAEYGVVSVLPYVCRRAYLVTTGSEIQTGRIVDKAGPILTRKLSEYGVTVVDQVFPGDDVNQIAGAIAAATKQGAELVLVTGGMSVDPDDRSPAAIRQAADRVVRYGTPILPGSMLMLAYLGSTAIFGLPGAVIYDQRTSFDVLLPRVLAGLPVTPADIAQLGVGGWLNA